MSDDCDHRWSYSATAWTQPRDKRTARPSVVTALCTNCRLLITFKPESTGQWIDVGGTIPTLVPVATHSWKAE